MNTEIVWDGINILVMNYYKLTIPRLIMFMIFLISGAIYFFKNDLSKLSYYEIIMSVLIFSILIFLVLSKLLSLKKLNNK